MSYRGIEAGHIFVLGTKYSAPMRATFVDDQQEQRPLVMGCYGIGVSRLVATTIEQHHDEAGMRWPMSLAPYQVHLVTLGTEDRVTTTAGQIYEELEAAGVEVLWDDRDERPGVKFKDADLIGVPLRVTVGVKGLVTGHVELKPREQVDPKKVEMLPVAQAGALIAARVRAALSA
jgi:prolyl-tRNA synthetase